MPKRLAFERAWRPLAFAACWLASSLPLQAAAKEPVTPEPSPVMVAEQRAAEAFQAYTRKEYAAAVALYLEAYEAAPSGSMLYNIARIYDLKLGDRPLAITYYRRYIAAPDGFTERIELANQRLKELREAEERASAAALPAESAAEGAAETQPGARALLPTASDPPRADRGGWSTLRWTGVGVGLVGLGAVGAGAGFGIAALSQASTAEDACDGNACRSQEGVDAAQSAASQARLSNLGFGVGGALLLTGTALFLLGGEPTAEASPRAKLRWETQVSDASLSLRVSGRW